MIARKPIITTDYEGDHGGPPGVTPWRAYYPDQIDLDRYGQPTTVTGIGRTEEEAIADLKEQLAEREDDDDLD